MDRLSVDRFVQIPHFVYCKEALIIPSYDGYGNEVQYIRKLSLLVHMAG